MVICTRCLYLAAPLSENKWSGMEGGMFPWAHNRQHIYSQFESHFFNKQLLVSVTYTGLGLLRGKQQNPAFQELTVSWDRSLGRY